MLVLSAVKFISTQLISSGSRGSILCSKIDVRIAAFARGSCSRADFNFSGRMQSGLVRQVRGGFGSTLYSVSILVMTTSRGARMHYRMPLTFISLVLLLLVYLPSGAGAPEKHNKPKTDDGKSIVYVCACMKDKSCSCMTEAKMEGPCACGTMGGPPMKAVSADSDWARQNREALAK